MRRKVPARGPSGRSGAFLGGARDPVQRSGAPTNEHPTDAGAL